MKKVRVRTIYSNHSHPVFPNLIKNIVTTALNQVWVSDITHIRCATEFAYLSIILEIYSRRVIGYHLSYHLDTTLTLSSLLMAISKRHPLPGCIHHSDQGVQYASSEYIKELERHGFRISMARKGNVFDSAVCESFLKTLKYEEVYLSEYRSLEDAQRNIAHFIEDVYNAKRLHSSLGHCPPNEFEEFMRDTNKKTTLYQITLT